jgi:hypothetical protein
LNIGHMALCATIEASALEEESAACALLELDCSM